MTCAHSAFGLETGMRIVSVVSLHVMAALLCLVLGGCAVTYDVAIDSLREGEAAGSCFLAPDPALEVGEDDLLFREVCSLVTPALDAQGMPVAASRKEAAQEVLLRYGMDEPTTVLRQWTYPDYQTVFYHGRAITVRVERTEWSVQTRYHARLVLTARRLKDGRPGRQTWRTEMVASGGVDDLRKLLRMGIPALRQVVASRTSGICRFEVAEARDGELTVSSGE